MILRYYQRILESCEPYLVARPGVRDGIDANPFGIAIPDENIVDPQRVGGREFINLIKHLNAMTFAPEGQQMPSWVFYDCAVMPGAIFGFARRASEVAPWFRAALGVPDGYEGLVPMSLFIVIPTVDPQMNLAYSLCSVNQVSSGAAPEGLWRLTLAAGTRALGVETLLAVTQWRSAHLGLFAGLGPLELVTAWTPAHDNPATATFRVRCNADARARLLRGDLMGAEGIHEYLDADDYGAMQSLQARIEAGAQVAVAGPAEIRGAATRIPLQVRSGPEEFAPASDIGFTRRFQG